MKHRSAEAMARRAEKRGTTVEEQKKIDRGEKPGKAPTRHRNDEEATPGAAPKAHRRSADRSFSRGLPCFGRQFVQFHAPWRELVNASARPSPQHASVAWKKELHESHTTPYSTTFLHDGQTLSCFVVLRRIALTN